MLDVSLSYTRYMFIGHEFLTWLWFVIEEDQDSIRNLHDSPISFEMGNRMVLEKTANNQTENIVITGDIAGLEEGRVSLQKGAVVTDMNLCIKSGELEWKLNIKGKTLGLSGIKTPAAGVVEKKEDLEGAILEKIYLYEKACSVVDSLFKMFIEKRVSSDWDEKTVQRIKKWIHSGSR